MHLIAHLKSSILPSILYFGTISFITVLTDLNSPWNRDDIDLDIGFPFTYYYEFMEDCPIPNSGWNTPNLMLDFLITWIVVTSVNIGVKKFQSPISR